MTYQYIIIYLQLLLDHHKLPSLLQQKAALHSHQHAPWWPVAKVIGELQTLRIYLFGLEFVGSLIYDCHNSTSCSILDTSCSIMDTSCSILATHAISPLNWYMSIFDSLFLLCLYLQELSCSAAGSNFIRQDKLNSIYSKITWSALSANQQPRTYRPPGICWLLHNQREWRYVLPGRCCITGSVVPEKPVVSRADACSIGQ